MAKYKVNAKYVVTEGWNNDVKTFDSEREAKEFAMTLNEAYNAGIEYAVKNPAKVEAIANSNY